MFWLQEYKLTNGVKEATELWTLLPKGTEVFLVSTAWLQQVYDQISAVQSASDLEAVLNTVRLDNSAILSSPNTLKPNVFPRTHYEPVPESVFRHCFSPFATDPTHVITAFIVWEGILRPALLFEPYEIGCMLQYKDQKVTYELQLEGNVTVATVRERLAKTRLFTLEKGTELVLWNVRSPYSPQDLVSVLGKTTDFSTVSWLSPVNAGDDDKILEAITAKVLVVEFKPEKSFIAALFGSKPKARTIGLQNIAKNCYFNSVLQSLARTYPFLMHYTGKPISILDKPAVTETRATLSALYESHTNPFFPQEICTLLKDQSDSFLPGRHADAHECLQSYITMLDFPATPGPAPTLPLMTTSEFKDEQHWVDYLASSSMVSGDVFGGMQRTELRCQSCGHSTVTYTPFTTLSLYLPAVRTIAITLVPLDGKEGAKQFQIQSSTPVESNETFRSIWRQIAEMQGISGFMIGELRNRLFKGPIGMTNIAVQTNYLVMELPAEGDVENCVILVDVCHDNGTDCIPIASRVFKMPKATPLSEVQNRVLTALVDIELSKTGLNKHISNLLWTELTAQEAFQTLNSGARMFPLTLDCSEPSTGPLELNSSADMNTIWDLCKLREGKVPRFRLNLKHMPSDLTHNLQKHSPSQSYFFSLFNDSTDDDTVLTLLQMLDYTLNDKPLNEEDKVVCEECKESSQHVVGTCITHFPRVMVFALQRVRLVASELKKSTIAIQYPTRGLDLSNYEKGARSDLRALYDLKAVVLHSGSLTRGHYKTRAQDPATGLWFEFDDESAVAQDEMSAIDEKEAYLLFYVRKSSLSP